MTEWSFLTNHARVLVCIAHDPGVRLPRHRHDAGHHRTQRLQHRHRPDHQRLRRQGQGRPTQPLPDPGSPAATRSHHPATHDRRGTRRPRRIRHPHPTPTSTRVIRRPVAPRRPPRPTRLRHHRGQAVHPVKVGDVTTGIPLVTRRWSLPRCCRIHVVRQPSVGKRSVSTPSPVASGDGRLAGQTVRRWRTRGCTVRTADGVEDRGVQGKARHASAATRTPPQNAVRRHARTSRPNTAAEQHARRT